MKRFALAVTAAAGALTTVALVTMPTVADAVVHKLPAMGRR